MTGFFEASKHQPLSRVTIGALADLEVFECLDYSQADAWPYSPPTSQVADGAGAGGEQSTILQAQSTFNLGDLIEDIVPIDIHLIL